MTVVDPRYYDETVLALGRAGVAIRHFTLVAPVATILARLVARDAERNQWACDRVVDCVASLGDPGFAEHVDAEGRGTSEIATEILERLAA